MTSLPYFLFHACLAASTADMKTNNLLDRVMVIGTGFLPNTPTDIGLTLLMLLWEVIGTGGMLMLYTLIGIGMISYFKCMAMVIALMNRVATILRWLPHFKDIPRPTFLVHHPLPAPLSSPMLPNLGRMLIWSTVGWRRSPRRGSPWRETCSVVVNWLRSRRGRATSHSTAGPTRGSHSRVLPSLMRLPMRHY